MIRLTYTGFRVSSALVALTLGAIPGAFGYIGETITTTDTPAQTVQITHADAASLQFYLNSLVVAGAKSSLSGITVVTGGSSPVIAVENSMATWNNIGSANIAFQALLTTTVGHNSSDCLNVISIGSSAADLSVLGFVSAASPGVVAVTANAYITTAGSVCSGSTSVPAGTIVDSDIVMNPYIGFSTDGTATTQDVQAVITHEFGHVLGMNHSSLLGATMYPYAATHERHPSWDEKAFAATYYASGKKTLGTIGGTVTVGSSPVAYGLVVMTDVSGGGKVVGALTGADGTYSANVPPGTYNVYAEPFNSFIGATNIYSLTSATGTLTAASATTAFQPTFSGGNTPNPATFVITGGSSATANISVISGATTLAQPFYGIGNAGATGDIKTYSTFNGAIPVTAGTSFDIAFTGVGIDSTIQVVYIGTNVTVVGSPRVDASGTVNGQPIIRQTFSVGSQTNSTMGTLWIVKGSNYLPYSGILDLEPMVPTVNSILGLDSFGASLTSGQFASVYGANLSNGTRIWNGSTDFTGGVAAGAPLPTQLDGIGVTINSVPAAVYSIGPSQINFIVPSSLSSGPATVVVSNAGTSTSSIASASIVQASPSFSEYFAGSNYYVSAYHGNYTQVGDPAVLSGTTKAHPGEEIFMYATGLAPANGGTIVTASEFAQTAVSVTAVGPSGTINLPVAPSPDGKLAPYLIEAGLFQINVTLPSTLATGNYAITMTVPNGSTSTAGVTVMLPVGP